ncbi:sugar transferase [Eubacterium maltosivorans]|uniref:Sugar transferase n=1 Tax=Eubacterium maltosivorans TaxID=2041044 RepID=A0A4P9C7Z6_EUBML|nr:sugar transferase [Eubacterium maltosivorans]QCT70871.1 sugar transferase [Eubacterium maltosivorans]
MLKGWEHLPKYMQTESVRPYYEKLKKRKISLALKRIFDVAMSAFMLIVLSPVMLIISIAIVMDSKGGVFFRQERVTQYGRKFRIFKFRTMVANADKLGSQVTVKNDMRVTKVGAVIRKYRIDEIPQLINIMLGDMSYVGTRPEVMKYVKSYTPEMMATLLLPAGVTSEASIKYKDEENLLEGTIDVDYVYVNKILPEKMNFNFQYLNEFSLTKDIFIMFRTVFIVVSRRKG